MQVGSIVVVLPLHIPPECIPDPIKWLPVQDEKTPYMVRSIDHLKHGVSVCLEEGVIGYSYTGGEWGIRPEFLREVLPPEDLTEFIEECCCVPKEN